MKCLFRIAILAVLGLAPLSVFAETITDFRVTATLDPSRTVVFEEKISYDFEDVEKHGIFRYIPVSYERNGASYRLRIKVLGVTRDGKDEPYDETEESGNLRLKIGDPDVTITGPHAYVIRYSTDRAINSFADHDELYWNVTGNDWPAPIEKASFTFILPPTADIGSVTSTCFTGTVGSTEHSCIVTPSSAGVTAETTRLLLQDEGFTVVFGFPPGVVHELSSAEKTWQLVTDNGVLFFPIMAFAVMFVVWWRRGRDPRQGTLIPEYEPPRGLSPALVGAAMSNGTVPAKAVTATIIDLARRGYLKIRFGEEKHALSTKQTFTFVKILKDQAGLAKYETDILSRMFLKESERTIKQLEDDQFYQAIVRFKKHVESTIDKMKLFDANPVLVRFAYIAVAVLVTFVVFWFFGSTNLGFIATVLTGLIIVGFGWLMPRRTIEGRKLLTDIEGFKWFLSVTEKDRMSFHNAPERNPEQFQALLPYAIIFGVEKQWAAQFASLNLPPPSWAEGTAISNWNMAVFVSQIGSLHTAATSSAYAAPSSAGSGGSGFSGGGSGGGFGGGGGGSW